MTHATQLGSNSAELREIGEEYELLAELGRGGMAVVYLARDRELGREVAIKVMHASAAADDEAIARLFVEARTVAQLQHPNVVSIHAVRRLSRNGLALVMQYVPGRSLERALREDGLFAGERAEAILADVAAALAYAHARGVIHRDVKPGNIFLNDETGRALLSDFGIAISAEARGAKATPSDLIVGTPAYMSPEQIDGLALDGRSDVYSLGLVGYDMLAGVRPWIDEAPSDVMYRQKFDALPPLAELRPDVDTRTVGIVERALTKDREARTPGAAAFLSALTEDEWTPGARPTPAVPAAIVAEGTGTPRSVPLVAAPPSHEPVQTAHFRRDAPSGNDGLSPLWPQSPPTAHPRRTAIMVGLLMVLAAVAAVAAFVPRETLDRFFPALTPKSHQLNVHDSVETLDLQSPLSVRTRDSLAALAAASSANRDSGGLTDTAANKTGTHGGDSAVSSAVGTNTKTPPPIQPSPTSKKRDADSAATHVAQTSGTIQSGAQNTSQNKPAHTPPPAAALAPTAPPPAPPPTPIVHPAIHPPTPPTIVAGGMHTCALTGDGRAWCWGSNDRGQLGVGNATGTTRSSAPMRVAADVTFDQISVGLGHSCAITNTGTVYCWGANDYGQLGDSTTTTRMAPVRGAAGHSYRQIEVGTSHTCGLMIGGDVYCWGRNAYGQLGNGSVSNTSIPTRVTGSVKFVALAVGWNHSCALSEIGEAYCWGQNAYGQLGDGTPIVRATPTEVSSDSVMFRAIAAGGSHTCALSADGQAYCWGRNNYGQLGTGDAQDHMTPAKVATNVTFISLTAGGVHTCGLTGAGEVYCWGHNTYGQLGDGTTMDRPTPVRVGSLQTFTSIHASGSHTCARASTGTTYCWGYNSDGQIGDGTISSRELPTLVRTQ